MISRPLFLTAIFGVTLLAAGCAGSSIQERRSYLTPEANGVRVIKQFPPNCTPAGSVEGLGAAQASGQTVWTFAMNDMRNKAAAQGITTVVLERYKHENDGNILAVRVFGKLMRCGAGENGTRPDTRGDRTPTYGSVKPTPPPTNDGNIGKPKPTEEPKPSEDGKTTPPVDPPGEEF